MTGETSGVGSPDRLWRSAANQQQNLRLAAQFGRYVGCAGLAALGNFIAGSILVDHLGFTTAWRFTLAVATAYALGMLVNFLLNRRYTFSSDRAGLDQARTFIIVALSGLALTMVVALVTRHALTTGSGHALLPLPGSLGTPETLSRGIAIAAASVYSFTAHKYLTFNRGIRWPLLRLVRALQFGG